MYPCKPICPGDVKHENLISIENLKNSGKLPEKKYQNYISLTVNWIELDAVWGISYTFTE